jgi:hypothetical protein
MRSRERKTPVGVVNNGASLRAMGRKETEMDFDEWWIRKGRFIDTEPSVSAADKMKDMMSMAWEAARAQSTCYVADDAVFARKVTFANGRTVSIVHAGPSSPCLEVGVGPYPGE